MADKIVVKEAMLEDQNETIAKLKQDLQSVRNKQAEYTQREEQLLAQLDDLQVQYDHLQRKWDSSQRDREQADRRERDRTVS